MRPTENVEPARADIHQERNLYIQNAIELALSLGDFQKEIQSECAPQLIASAAIERLCQLIPFKTSAIFLVDDATADMQLSVCVPISAKHIMEAEMAFMIEHGFVAWAIREKRGITVFSKDKSRQVLLHVIATYSRIRGLFMGILPAQSRNLPTASLEIASLILRNAANSIESIMYSAMLQDQKQNLEDEVDRKTQQLVRYEKQLLQAQISDAIAALAGGVAHQFNNALHALTGNIDLIAMMVPNESKLNPCIERTRPLIERMSNLTNQLIAYAQGGNLVATQVITLKALFDEILPTIKQSVKETVQLDLKLSDEWLGVDVDLIQIRTVILAIVTNADEAIADEGSIQISSQQLQWNQVPKEIRIELKPGDHACISIQDDGTGMDSHTLRRLFEPFYSTKFTGRGLSMAAVSGIVKRHGGWITVFSEIEKGTCVRIYLPKASEPIG